MTSHRLCGLVYCDRCSNQKLLLHFDTQNRGVATLIGVVGCPDREPKISMYLSICTLCEDDMEEYQVTTIWHIFGLSTGANFDLRSYMFVRHTTSKTKLICRIFASNSNDWVKITWGYIQLYPSLLVTDEKCHVIVIKNQKVQLT